MISNNMKQIIYKLLTFSTIRIKNLLNIRYNRFLFSLAGINYGNNLQIINKIYLRKERNSKITIGSNFLFTSGDSINPLSRNIRGCIYVKQNAEIVIGNNVGISSACLWANSSIKIGNNVKIGGDCIIIDTDAHSLDHINRRYFQSDNLNTHNAPITIEDDVLIGTRCIILKGVTIGARSIIGAGSIVSKNIPADCIAAGNPAKVIKQL